MSTLRFATAALAVTAMLAMPAFAQQGGAPTAAPAGSGTGSGNGSGAGGGTGMASAGPSGTLQKAHGDWRAAQLVGATVYNDAGNSIGTIDNLLISNDGKVAQAVLSVGGFLGIGNKLVAVPFNHLKFEQSRPAMMGTAGLAPLGAPGTAPGSARSGGDAATSSAAATNGNGGTGAQPQYFSVVLPGATQNSLRSMQSFTYGG